MVQRISITIPEPLFKRVQKIKANKSFNISRICQEALEREVAVEELREKTKDHVKDMKDVIERLRLEKQEIDKKDEDTGYKMGFEDAQNWSYESLSALDASALELDPFDDSDLWAEVEAKVLALRDKNPLNLELFCKGYCKGVKDFWDSVKDYLK